MKDLKGVLITENYKSMHMVVTPVFCGRTMNKTLQ
jgi:hypothetical protein